MFIIFENSGLKWTIKIDCVIELKNLNTYIGVWIPDQCMKSDQNKLKSNIFIAYDIFDKIINTRIFDYIIL